MNADKAIFPMSVRGLSLSEAAAGELCPIDFELAEGEILAVLGENGAGKSLLLSCISGHLHPPGASVHVFGKNLFHHRQRVAAQEPLGVVFQRPGLIRNLNVFENVALPFLVHGLVLDHQLTEQVLLRLELVGCAHLAHADLHALSDGDRRCVAIARALSGATRLLVADEPVSALSPGKKALVEELIVCLVENRLLSAAIVATQDVEFATRIASRFLVLQKAEGRPGGRSALMERSEAADNAIFREFNAGRQG